MCKPTNLTSGKVAILPVVVTKNLLLSLRFSPYNFFYGDARLQLVNQRLYFGQWPKTGVPGAFLAKNGCTLKTIAAESVVGRI